MNCSKLNYHLFLLHVADSAQCACGNNREDSSHFLLKCPLYNREREEMLMQLNLLCDLPISCHMLLFGSEELEYKANCKLFEVVHTFIETTNRL